MLNPIFENAYFVNGAGLLEELLYINLFYFIVCLEY
jgi:hypothetical protein